MVVKSEETSKQVVVARWADKEATNDDCVREHAANDAVVSAIAVVALPARVLEVGGLMWAMKCRPE